MSRGPRPSTSANPAGLTRREQDVLDLVATGLTNVEIGERLFVSPRTVEHHLAAAEKNGHRLQQLCPRPQTPDAGRAHHLVAGEAEEITTEFADVTGQEAGLASALFNTSQQIGGALGVALFSTVATNRTGDSRTPEALTSGFSLAFWVAVGFSAAAIVATLVMIRREELTAVSAEG